VRTRTLPAVVVRALAGAALAGIPACNEVLGLDAPTLNRCELVPSPCIDAALGGSDATLEAGPQADDAAGEAAAADTAVEETGSDATLPPDAARVDAANDVPAEGPTGYGTVRCGAASTATHCVLANSVCCQTAGSSGMPAFDCVPRGSCAGFPIECANTNDCMTNFICCHYDLGMRCEPPNGPRSSCPLVAMQTVTQACDPSIQNECPAGSSCTLPLVNDGQPSPYLGCP
jgi:hypothetical protein